MTDDDDDDDDDDDNDDDVDDDDDNNDDNDDNDNNDNNDDNDDSVVSDLVHPGLNSRCWETHIGEIFPIFWVLGKMFKKTGEIQGKGLEEGYLQYSGELQKLLVPRWGQEGVKKHLSGGRKEVLLLGLSR